MDITIKTFRKFLEDFRDKYKVSGKDSPVEVIFFNLGNGPNRLPWEEHGVEAKFLSRLFGVPTVVVYGKFRVTGQPWQFQPRWLMTFSDIFSRLPYHEGNSTGALKVLNELEKEYDNGNERIAEVVHS